ncbi:MAG TPA: glycoside hydrolase family 3 N-terminal domain-containing protein, partial [Cytophagales bacterium]|nr:glycoside hydrolase family 3 N-terminal domain-containing protein [Cytophagales bacterium]
MLKSIRPLLFSAFFLFVFNTYSQVSPGKAQELPPFLNPSKQWVDSVFKTLSQEEKIAQMMMIRVMSNKNQQYEDSLSNSLQKYPVGGLIFFQGGPVRQAKMTNRFQSEAKVPFLVAIDGEWGLGMRLDSTISFPYQMTLGAIQDDSLIYRMGAAVAQHCKRMGIHINFAPVVDINNNPNNPVISYRSFGENKENVAQKSYMYMRGMQDNGILTTAKHFPGHGDTDVDSHYGLPLINFDRNRLDSLELYPFRYLIERGLAGVMVAHLSIPKLDPTENLPSTLSKPIITDLLKKELGFQGLVFTDALDMKGVTKYFKPGDLDVKAVMAGNDVLELSENIPVAIDAIKAAIKKGDIKQSDIDSRCRKILEAKFWAGLDMYKPVELNNLVEDLNDPYSQALNRQLTKASLTLLKNDLDIVPIRNLYSSKIVAVAVNTSRPPVFHEMLGNYTNVNSIALPSKPSSEALREVRKAVEEADIVILSVHQDGRPRNIKLDPLTLSIIDDIN